MYIVSFHDSNKFVTRLFRNENYVLSQSYKSNNSWISQPAITQLTQKIDLYVIHTSLPPDIVF